jgi:hypothetical protein
MKNNMHFPSKNEKIHKYKGVEENPKWKESKVSTSNTQAQAVGRGEGARREAEGKKNHLKKKPKRHGNAADDETCHAKRKKSTTLGTWNITLGPTLGAKQFCFFKFWMLFFCDFAPKIRNFIQNYTTKTKNSS